jgi:cell division control protein 12
MLTKENLDMIQENPKEKLIMERFLKANLEENKDFIEENEYNFESGSENKESLEFEGKVSSKSTIKSVYFESSQSSLSSEVSIGQELQGMVDDDSSEKICYNIMVAGDSGLGKTSFIQTFMYLKFNFFEKFEDRLGLVPTTTEIAHTRARRIKGKYEFIIDMIDTPGYGSFRDVKNWAKHITGFMLEQIVKHSENQNQNDGRVHCCLYFIDFILKQNDIYALKELSKYTVIIPIIGKADICTLEEIRKYKKTVMEQINSAGIRVFQYESDGKTVEIGSCLGNCPPFCVISAVSRYNTGARLSYGRQYNWGYCDVNNPSHSDFPRISKYLIGRFYKQIEKEARTRFSKIVGYWNRSKMNRQRQIEEIKKREQEERIEMIGKIFTGVVIGIVKLFRNA